jgi:hypothetical protein
MTQSMLIPMFTPMLCDYDQGSPAIKADMAHQSGAGGTWPPASRHGSEFFVLVARHPETGGRTPMHEPGRRRRRRGLSGCTRHLPRRLRTLARHSHHPAARCASDRGQPSPAHSVIPFREEPLARPCVSLTEPSNNRPRPPCMRVPETPPLGIRAGFSFGR